MWKHNIILILTYLAIIVQIDIQVECFVEFIFSLSQKWKANSQNIMNNFKIQ